MRRYVIALGQVMVSTLLGVAIGAESGTASLLLLGAVVMSALRGRRAGLLAAVAGGAALVLFFTPKSNGAVQVPRAQDLSVFLAFLAVAAVVGTSSARSYHARIRAELRHQEANLRLELTTSLLSGTPVPTVAEQAANAIVEMFRLAAGTVSMAGATVTVTAPARVPAGRQGPTLRANYGDVEVAATGSRGQPLTADDRAVLDALAVGLATALDKVRLEREAAEARLAVTADHIRSSFLSLVSHNLRTPLAAIKAAVSTLQDGDVFLASSERAELRATIHEEADRLEHLVSKVLDFTRIRAGALDLDCRPADMADLAAAAVRRLRPVAAGRELLVDIPDALPEVDMDEVMMEQVFLNLLENALRHAPPGSAIKVHGRVGGGDVEVRVSDHGLGVAAEDRERIFEAFVRADSSHDSVGTGLGLAIVRGIVSGHGGVAWYEDTPGGGATFAFRLPPSPDTGSLQ